MLFRSLLACAALALASLALAQTAPLTQRDVPFTLDSGAVSNPTPDQATVFSHLVRVDDASWLRLTFRRADLAPGAFLRLTSLFDGHQQTLHAEHLRQWSFTSAYFNGDAVFVEIVAPPHSLPSRLVITSVIAGEPVAPESICGPTDDRVLSSDPRSARLMPIGCTIWIFDDANHTFLTAGHCISNGTSNAVAQFNVPLSNPNGTVNHPPPSDQYPIDPVSIQSNGGQGTGNDWAYCGAFPNSVTGKTPFEAQGAFFSTTPSPPVSGQQIRITGYGVVGSPVSPTWNQVQKTHLGPYFSKSGTWIQYQTDTTGGNSGSPVINEATGEAIGIHTHGGCSGSAGNTGTAFEHTALQNALANPKGVCIPNGLKFAFPSGLPTSLNAGGGTAFSFVVLPNGAFSPLPGSGKLFYAISRSWIELPLIQTGPNEYLAEFPPIPCPSSVNFYFEASTTTGETHRDPPNAPNSFYNAYVGTLQQTTVFETSFNSLPQGWSASGLWHITSACSSGTSCDGGTFAYYGLDASCTFNTGSSNSGSLSSNPLALPALPAGGSVSLEFCYSLQTEQLEPYDHASILINGVEVAALLDVSGWTPHSIDLSSFAGSSPTIAFRFDTVDSAFNDYRGFQVDGVKIIASSLTCDCYADCELDGDLDVFDYLCFLGRYAAQDPYADCEGDGDWDVFDFLCFQSQYAAGC